ncbi:uncharacterized protein [Physcomitrium patens]|uniref:PH domain-containing protein n=2 Tax=Physcomitrium patens TaxID=3218 RepID=A0A2K1IJN6_PHYPA|nr:differentially expressed in FDCP 6 homolog isoform X2 [Physcomitrium patens]PNR29487.1 hypothetical protein PHYPA_028181 [Physcomitrium patens]|eukprot:XP_024362829.1 differentially expressed in FDCP 6 homolog isoform X2 [Physcomitrella patens]
MSQAGGEDLKAKLEKIKKQLSASSGSVLLQGPLLKRSETLRKWNQRWFTLDPSTGRMEYRFQRSDPSPRGLIHFDADSTITVSPLNIQGDRKYDGCCFYIGTSQKKESFLCAETPAAARAWVATLRAAALVLKAHKEAVNSLSGNGHAKLGTVAASVAAANATAQEAMKDVQASFRPSVAIPQSSALAANNSVDNSIILKETLRVKDEELNQLQRDLRARDLTIKELAERLSETADAAESAAKAVHYVDKERQVAVTEIEHLKKELQRASDEIKAAEEKVVAANMMRDLALQEAHRWRVELGKAREQCVIMEGAVQRGHEHARQLKIAHEQQLASLYQAQEPSAAGTQVNLKAQDERPATAETMTDSGDVAVVEPLAVPIPAVASAAENTASIRNVQEVTQTPPQLPSSAPQVAENIVHPTLPPENVMNQSPPVMTVDLPPQAPEVGNNIEHSSPLAGAPPPIEHTLPHGAFQGEEGQPLVEETSVEFATPAPSDQNQLSNQGTPSTA